MACGLFGKLISKRDFIAVNTPKDFLLPWEAWMQGGLSASKNTLEGAWLAAYLAGPLWRFWLGGDVVGSAVKGVFMPSMDGVGRHYPLTVFAAAEAGKAFPAPFEGADTAWYEAAEDFLLATIDHPEDYDAVLAKLAELEIGETVTAQTAADVLDQHGAQILAAAEDADVLASLVALDAERLRREARGRSYFWTVGGPDFRPTAITASGLPSPHIMSPMLTGVPVAAMPEG